MRLSPSDKPEAAEHLVEGPVRVLEADQSAGRVKVPNWYSKVMSSFFTVSDISPPLLFLLKLDNLEL